MEAESKFWDFAAKNGLPWFRFLRRPVPIEQLDRRFTGSRLQADWEQLKRIMEQGDEIWPFEFNVRKYLGLRKGYLVLRRGNPIGGIITTVS